MHEGDGLLIFYEVLLNLFLKNLESKCQNLIVALEVIICAWKPKPYFCIRLSKWGLDSWSDSFRNQTIAKSLIELVAQEP